MVTLLAASGFHTEDAILIVVIVLLLVASGVLAMAETSLVRMSRIKAKSLVDEKRRGARQLARLVENPANFLNPILLLVLICQLVSAIASTPEPTSNTTITTIRTASST